jgi:transposase
MSDDNRFRAEGAFPEEPNPPGPEPPAPPPEPDPPLTDPNGQPLPPVPKVPPQPRGRRLAKPGDDSRHLTPQQRLLILDVWKRSELPAGDFAALVGVSKHTLYAWDKRFQQEGPAGLFDKPAGPPEGSRLPEITRRTILMLKKANADYGVQRISDLLLRGPGLSASPSAVARVFHEAGYEFEENVSHPHPDKPRFFERAKPNQLLGSLTEFGPT